MIPELGFCLGSRAQMFWLDEGLPASLEPGARPRTTLTPTLVLRAPEVPPSQLGGSARLGLTSWIGQRPATDADDLSLTAPQQTLP